MGGCKWAEIKLTFDEELRISQGTGAVVNLDFLVRVEALL